MTALQSLGDREAGSDAWARLPRRVARDLRDGLREEFPPEYREMLRTYYRVLAERSRTE